MSWVKKEWGQPQNETNNIYKNSFILRFAPLLFVNVKFIILIFYVLIFLTHQLNQAAGPPPQQSPQQQLPPIQTEPQEDKNDDSKLKMFVGGLGLLTEEQLKDYFTKIGEVDNILLLRGFGFITFKAAETVEKAITEAKVINGKTMHCISGKYVECKRTFAKVG